MTDRRLLIVKTGSASEPIFTAHGNFEDWIRDGLGIAERQVLVCDVVRGQPLPTHGEVAAVVITGSPAMLTEQPPWLDSATRWVEEAVHEGLPILGICFGHQLLAHCLGGVVAPNPAGREMGTISVTLLPQCEGDPILGGFGDRIEVQATHVESVTGLPHSAHHLASSSLDPNLGFRVGDNVWGVQFHPEFGAEIMKAYLRERRRVLSEEGFDVDGLITEVRESPHGRQILQRFAALA